jgi:FtsH ternary system domain X6
MKTVSHFEANLVRMLRSILQRGPRERIVSILKQPIGRPSCLSRSAVELVQDTLGKGSVWLLARTGWRLERHLRQGEIRAGRLWQRTPPEDLSLTFSRHSLEFLLTLMDHAPAVLSRGKAEKEEAAQKKDAEKPAILPWQAPISELAIGDRLLFYWTYEALRPTDLAKSLQRHDYFIQDGLCRLAFPVRAFWKPCKSPLPITGCGSNAARNESASGNGCALSVSLRIESSPVSRPS